MIRIKLLGPPSEKYELLKQRIMAILELSEQHIPIVEIQDINRIMAENINIVPTAIYEGQRTFHWTMDTGFDEMKKSFMDDLNGQRPSASVQNPPLEK